MLPALGTDGPVLELEAVACRSFLVGLEVDSRPDQVEADSIAGLAAERSIAAADLAVRTHIAVAEVL